MVGCSGDIALESTDAAAVALRYHNVYGARMPRDTPKAEPKPGDKPKKPARVE